VLVAMIVGVLLLVGVNPFGDDSGLRVGDGVGVVGNLVFALVAILEGRPVLGVVGVFVPLLALSRLCGWPGRPHPGRAAATTTAEWRGRAAPAGTGS
jgi:hypothetical protein